MTLIILPRIESLHQTRGDSFFPSLEWEVLSRHQFADTRHAQAVVLEWCYGFYNHTRRHSSAGMMAPITYETTALNREAA